MRRAVLLLVALAAAVLAVPVSATAQSGDAAPTFVNGTASSSGTVASARVYYAGLSIPVPIGQSAASYEGRRSRALGAVVSAAAASSLTGADVPGTAPVAVDSQNEVKELESALADPLVGTVALDASGPPAASADVHVADLDVPGLLRVEGGHSTSSVRIEGEERIAESSVTIASIDLGGGTVALEGLRWDASHRSGATGVPETTAASFTLGGVRLGGASLPLPPVEQLGPLVDLLDTLLAPVGLSITLPAVERLADGSINAGSLRILLGNSILGRDAIGPLLAALRPVVTPVLEDVLSAAPSLGIATLLLDLGLGVADGSGGAELSLGGANAVTDGTVFDDPLAGGEVGPTEAPAVVADPAPPSSPSVVTTVRPGGSVAAAPSTGGAAVPPAYVPAAADAGPARCALAASPRRQGGCRSSNAGVALAVAIAAVLAAGVYEVAIRRRRVVAA